MVGVAVIGVAMFVVVAVIVPVPVSVSGIVLVVFGVCVGFGLEIISAFRSGYASVCLSVCLPVSV